MSTTTLRATALSVGESVHALNNALTTIAGHALFAAHLLEAGHPALEELAGIHDAVRRAAEVTRVLNAHSPR